MTDTGTVLVVETLPRTVGQNGREWVMQEEELVPGYCDVNEHCWEVVEMMGSALAHSAGMLETLTLGYVM